MRLRGALVEHPSDTLKRWSELGHFLMRGLAKYRGEFSLMTLSYNLYADIRFMPTLPFMCLIGKEMPAYLSAYPPPPSAGQTLAIAGRLPPGQGITITVA